MTPANPFVSIGLPIYNAGEQTSQIIESILAQSYPDFELIISDNASTDSTWEICQSYANQDARIRLCRNETNLGALVNFQHVFDLATGDYFAWVAHDDLWEPGYIGACVEKLESEPAAVLCYSDQIVTNTLTGTVTEIKHAFRGDHPRFGGRVQALLAKKPVPYAIIYGVYRRNLVQKALPLPTSAISDIHFLLKAAKLGIFVHVPQTLFKRMMTPKDFRVQMRRVFNRQVILPQSLVYVGFWLQLLGFAFTEGQDFIEKLQIAWAVTRYSGYAIVLHLIPQPVRRGIGPTVRRLFA